MKLEDNEVQIVQTFLDVATKDVIKKRELSMDLFRSLERRNFINESTKKSHLLEDAEFLKCLINIMANNLSKEVTKSAYTTCDISDYDLFFFMRTKIDRAAYQEANGLNFTRVQDEAICRARDKLQRWLRTTIAQMIDLMPLCDDPSEAQENSKKRVKKSPEEITTENEEKMAKHAKIIAQKNSQNITPIIGIPVPDGVPAYAVDDDDEDEVEEADEDEVEDEAGEAGEAEIKLHTKLERLLTRVYPDVSSTGIFLYMHEGILYSASERLNQTFFEALEQNWSHEALVQKPEISSSSSSCSSLTHVMNI